MATLRPHHLLIDRQEGIGGLVRIEMVFGSLPRPGGEIFAEELLHTPEEEGDAKPKRMEKILFFGGLILGLVEGLASLFLSAQLSEVIAYILLVIILLIRPTGLLGGRS